MAKWDEEFEKVLYETLQAKANSGQTSPFTPRLPTQPQIVYSGNQTKGGSRQPFVQTFNGNAGGSTPLVSSPTNVSSRVSSRVTVGNKKDEDEEKKWYQKGHFEDGYDWGDITKTILGIDEDTASLKDLTWNSLKRGYYNSLYGEESYKEMLGNPNEKEAYEKLLESEDFQFAPGNELASGISGAFEQVGQMARQYTHPRTLAFTGSAVGAAILAGNAGPQALVPEEIISVPAVATAAFKASSAASNFEIEAGHAYNEMIELGIKEDLAKKIALGVGAGNAGLELFQTDELFDAYKATAKSDTTKSVARLIVDELLKRGVDIGTETLQEDLQEGITIGGVQAANYLQNGEFAYSAEEVGERLWDTTKSSLLSFGVMNAPAAVKNTYSIVKDNKKAPGKNQTVQNEEHPIVEQIPQVEQEIQPQVEEVEPVTEVKPTEPQKPILYTGSANTDIKQFKVGGVDGSKQTGDRYGRGVYLTTNENTAKNYAGDSGRVYQINADDLNIFNLNDTITPEMRDSLISVFKGGDTQFRNSMLRNFRTQMTFDDFESAEAFFAHQRKVWKEQDGEYSANKPEILEADHETGRAVIEFTDFENWENNIESLTGNHLYDALKSLSTDDFSSFITGHGFDGIAFDEDADNQQYVIYRNEDRLRIDDGDTSLPAKESLTTEEVPTISEKETVDIAPTPEEISAPEVAVAENATTDADVQELQDEREVLQDTIMSRVEVNKVDETTEMLAKKWTKADNRIRSMESDSAKADSVAQSSVSEAETEANRPLTTVEKIQKKDRETHFAFEKFFTSDNPTNREQYNAVLYGTRQAQDVISKGTDGVKPISEIFRKISREGKLLDFEKYLYHYLNFDRTTLEERYGIENRPVFGEEGKDSEGNIYIKSYVPAQESKQIVDELEAKHPEFKAVAEEVYAYCDYLLRLRLESGTITQETYNRLREMYPHYVPIGRTRHDKQVSDDLVAFLNERDTAVFEHELEDFLSNVRFASAIFSPHRVGDDLYPVMDSLVDLTFRSFWDASLSKAGVDTHADIAPVPDTPMEAVISESPAIDTEDAPVENSVVESVSESATEEMQEALTAEESAPITDVSPVAEDVAPVESLVTEDTEEVPNVETAETLVAEAVPESATEEESDAQTTPVAPKTNTENSNPTVAEAITPKAGKKGIWQKLRDTWYTIEEFVFDKGFSFERLAKKTDNRQLEADWDMIRRSPSVAQHLIGNGSESNGVRSLVSIYEDVENAGTEQDFSDYLGHLRNVDGLTQYSRYGISNKSFMGRESSVAKSTQEINRLEEAHPEFKQLAEDVYKFNQYLIKQMVDHGLVTQEQVDMWNELYPHFVPMRRSDGTSVPVLESMAQFTLQVQHAIAMNDFGRNLEATLEDGGRFGDEVNITSFFSGLEAGGDMFWLEGGENPSLTIFVDGQEVTFNITEDMYVALKPTGDILSSSIPVVSDLNNLRKNLITAYNPWFTLKNFAKDIQEVLINSQHPLETYATLKTAILEIKNGGDWFQEYMENGGGSDTFFDMKHSEFGEGKGVTAFAETKTPLKYILKANNFVETTPRLAEYIASRQAGRSIEVSMLDSARVTTNFQAGGDLTKFLNRNGATFLNASVQGAVQQVRNIREAYHAGAKGMVGLIARYAVAAIPHFLLNNLVWDDDEDYQELPDYIINNYYIVWKYGDGKFLRIPKGRTAAVIQNAIEQVVATSSGDDEADWEELNKLFWENIAPNNPINDNMFAPIVQTYKNKTWYDEDIVPSRLQELDVTQQFDDKTDDLSIAIGQLLGVSPKKVNYLLDQYGGVLGDTLLPLSTPKAESPSDSFIGKAIAPLRDIFTTDSVLNNRVTGDFYETLESAEALSDSDDATMEDKLRSGILISAYVEISKLMQEQRDIQTSDLPDSEKYKRNRELKEQINQLQEDALNSIEDYNIDGIYAEAGGKRYNYSEKDDRWFEVKPKKADGTDNGYYKQEQAVTQDLGISYGEYWNNKKMYDDFYFVASGFDKESGADDVIETARTVFGYERFAEYANVLKSLKADKDKNGESIEGTRFQKVKDYVYGLDIPEIEKKILMKMQYPNYKGNNYEIVKWLNENDDISYAEWITILGELGYKVDENNLVTW